jgi:thiol-disulfide isomerase/thioredoxin
MFKGVLVSIALLFLYNQPGITQERKGLRTGDILPDLFMKVHTSEGIVQSMDLTKGKPVLIDFWATWCSSCMKKFPVLETLQAKYKNKLTILLVNSTSTRDNETKIRGFYEKWKAKHQRALTLPTVIDDKKLDSLFPHSLLPHYIWVGADGIIKGITSSEYVTEENIKALVNGDHLDLPLKSDQDTRGPLYANSDLPLDNLEQYAVFIKGRQEGLGGGSSGITIGNKVRGWCYRNLELARIFQFVAAKSFPGKGFDKNRYLVESNSLNVFASLPDKKLKSQHLYTYQLIVPEHKADSLWHFMLKDLNSYSDYYGRIELRIDTFLTIVNIMSSDSLPLKTCISNKKVKPAGIIMSFSTLIQWLSSQSWVKLPVNIESNVDDSFSIVVNPSATDMDSVNLSLKVYGLELVRRTSRVEYFIVSDKDKSSEVKDILK